MISSLASSEARSLRDDPPQCHYTAALKATERKKMEAATNSSGLLNGMPTVLFVSVIADIAEEAVSRVEEESNGSR
jgi:hypothetical protein